MSVLLSVGLCKIPPTQKRHRRDYENILHKAKYRWLLATTPRESNPGMVLMPPPPLRATLLTLKLWLDGSIIIPAYASSPEDSHIFITALCLSLVPQWESHGAQAARLGIDRMYPLCCYTAPPLSCGLSFSRYNEALHIHTPADIYFHFRNRTNGGIVYGGHTPL